MKITKGQGYWRNGDDEIFNAGRDWLLWNWKTKSGHYFSGKRAALEFIKIAALRD